jgi:hypothetical protein
MSATLLEVTRSLTEDLERFQQAILEEIEYPPRNVRVYAQTHLSITCKP